MAVIVTNTDAGLNGKTLEVAESDQTISGLKTYDRDPNPPFAVSSGSAKVDNLDADLLDGNEGAAFALLTGATFTGGVTISADFSVSGSAFITSAAGLVFTNSSGAVKERNRSVAMGDWATEAWADVKYKGDGADASWVVEVGDQISYRYTLIGHTIVINLYVATSSVVSTPAQLQVAVPAGFTTAFESAGAITYSDNGTAGIGTWLIGAGEQIIRFNKAGGGAWTNSTNLTSIHANMTFELA